MLKEAHESYFDFFIFGGVEHPICKRKHVMPHLIILDCEILVSDFPDQELIRPEIEASLDSHRELDEKYNGATYAKFIIVKSRDIEQIILNDFEKRQLNL